MRCPRSFSTCGRGRSATEVLTSGLLAVAALATFFVVTELTRSIAFGVAATLFEIAMEPRLYSYPKILVPVVALLLMQHYLRHPSRLRLVWLAAWTGIAVLFRHDLGVYASAGIGAALLVAYGTNWRQTVRVLAEYAVAVVALLSPYVLFVQWSEGITEHLHEAIEFAKGEAHQRFLTPPAFPFFFSADSVSWSRMDSAVFLFYAAHALAILCLVLLGRSKERPTGREPVAAAGFAMLLMYLLVVLRHPIDSRIQDVAALLAINGAWALAESWQRATAVLTGGPPPSLVRRFVPLMVAVVVVGGGLVNTWILGEVPTRLEETRVADGFGTIKHTIEAVEETGTVWPWERFLAGRGTARSGPLPARVHHKSRCRAAHVGSPGVLLLRPAAVWRRARAVPAARCLHDRARSGADARTHPARPDPVVLINEGRSDEFAKAYPEIDRYIRDAYAAVGSFKIRDGSLITVTIGRDMKSSGNLRARGLALRVRKTSGEQHGFDHAGWIRNPFACDIECRSVIDRCPDDRKAECHVDRPAEREQLDRNQPLIVIAGDDGIELAACGTAERWCRPGMDRRYRSRAPWRRKLRDAGPFHLPTK
jgi:hypothetical protein